MIKTYDIKAYEVDFPQATRMRIEQLINIVTEAEPADKTLVYYEELLEISRKYDLHKIIIEMLLALGGYYHNKGFDYEKAFQYYDQVEKYIDKTDDTDQQGRIYARLGSRSAIRGNLKDALGYFKKAEKLFDLKANTREQCINCRNLSSVYTMLREQDESFRYAKRCIELAELTKDTILTGLSYNNLGLLFQNHKEYEYSLENFYRAMEYFEDGSSFTHQIILHNNIGLTLAGLGKNHEGIKHLQKALSLTEKYGVLAKKANTLNNLGIMYRNINEYEKALSYFFKSFKISSRDLDPQLYTITLSNIGHISLIANFRDDGIRYLRESETLARELDNKTVLADILPILAESFAKNGEYKAAFEKIMELNKIQLKINNQQSKEKIDELRREFEYMKKEKEAEIHRLKNIELVEKNRQLQEALDNVKVLRGLVPICSNCKKIRDDRGFWNQLETYIAQHSEAQFTHGICPECIKKLYPEIDVDD